MKWSSSIRFAKLDKYIYSLFAFVLLSVLLSQIKSDFGTVSDVAMVFIALANLIFVVRAFNSDRQKKEKEAGDALMPIAFESKMVGDMLAQDVPSHIMTVEQEEQYIKLMTDIKKAKHIFPPQVKQIMESVIENSILFINYNTRMRSKAAAGAKIGDVERDGRIVNNQFLYDEEQWIWDNRALESQKLHQLSDAIDSYFTEEK
ncbi:hypothetical protein [Alteromonas portus]|uniref:hypothetical protein n=1 Tax=Alteromonas portus TaxID=2565549 RepID=UPI003BF915EE